MICFKSLPKEQVTMLTKKMEKALNEQIALEGYASFLYLAMASWCDQEGYEGSTAFMMRQSDEEMEHMKKIYGYISEMDGKAIVPGFKKPPTSFKSLPAMFKKVYEHEKKVTQSINELVALSSKENDHSTFNFLQWYVEEQREEEALMRMIQDRIKLIGSGPQSLYYIDKEVQGINEAEMKKEAAETGE